MSAPGKMHFRASIFPLANCPRPLSYCDTFEKHPLLATQLSYPNLRYYMPGYCLIYHYGIDVFFFGVLASLNSADTILLGS